MTTSTLLSLLDALRARRPHPHSPCPVSSSPTLTRTSLPHRTAPHDVFTHIHTASNQHQQRHLSLCRAFTTSSSNSITSCRKSGKPADTSRRRVKCCSYWRIELADSIQSSHEQGRLAANTELSRLLKEAHEQQRSSSAT
eukprot:gb/GEZJ01004944.1/.p2 GENE.gb/GEZJ01004944.1/~~gb/GEZJ01004944.1/.p2  ORF type:complete len:140 (-),score=5.90 gb/GEZJ01004944.1/:439-858(-)